jgi:hypothetical protein
VQFHQLTPNATAQLSKYCWVVTNFGGVPFTDGFAKRYDLHYKPKRLEIDGAIVQAQLSRLNFHAKGYRGGGVKVDQGVVLVQGDFSLKPAHGQERICSSFEHDSFGLHHRVSIRMRR